MLVKQDGTPETEADFRAAHPNTSFPRNLTDEVLASYGRARVVEEEMPAIGPFDVAEQNDRPSLVDGVWRRGWTVTRKPVPTSAVKAEAERRILAIVPEWKQRNLIAQATQLLHKGRATWTPQEQAAWEAGDAIWRQVAVIRAASDRIEAMDPIPRDFHEDKHWP